MTSNTSTHETTILRAAELFADAVDDYAWGPRDESIPASADACDYALSVAWRAGYEIVGQEVETETGRAYVIADENGNPTIAGDGRPRLLDESNAEDARILSQLTI